MIRKIAAQRFLIKEGVEDLSHPASEGFWQGVLNYGRRPTFKNDSIPTLEAHIFDYQGELYGEKLEIFFYPRLREEKKFSDIHALKAQIGQDILEAKRFFSDKKIFTTTSK